MMKDDIIYFLQYTLPEFIGAIGLIAIFAVVGVIMFVMFFTWAVLMTPFVIGNILLEKRSLR